MAIIRTDASLSDGGESVQDIGRPSADDSWRTWRGESPDEFFYLRENRQFSGKGLTNSGGGGGGGGPSVNPLHKFATYSWMWSLNVLNHAQTNNPESLIKGRKFRAGITVAEDMGSSDYHFDNMRIKSVISANQGTRGANALTFAFDIVEPYSMGGFLEDLDDAARRQGFNNYADCGIMLACKFDGFTDSGAHDTVGPYNFIVKLIQAKFTVTEAGTVYKCLAVAWNDQAFNEEVATTKTNGTISGRTVQEILSTGQNSLQALLNKIENAQVENGVQKEADQYYIVFPETQTSAEEQPVLGAASAGLVDNPIDLTEIWESAKGSSSSGDEGQYSFDQWPDQFKKYKLGSAKSAHDIGAKIYGFYKDNCSVIGKSPIMKQPEDNQTYTQTGFDNALSDQDRMVMDTKNSRLPGDSQTMQVNAGTRVINIIEEVIIASEYGREYGANKDADGDNKIDWFRLSSYVLATKGPKESEAGRTGKIYIIRVIPYKAALNRFSAPGTTGKGGGSPARIYDYIYTGKNHDILDLDLDFNYSFYVPIGQDVGQNERTRLEGVPGAQSDAAPDLVPKIASGSAGANADQVANAHKKGSTQSRGTGAQLPQHPESQINRYWHETLMNSPVDLLNIKMKIHGDPYFLTSNGCGNFIDGGKNETSTGQIEYIRSEADIRINFETPIDLGVPWYKMSKYQFTGMYQVLTVDTVFSREGFTQTLNCLRHRQQGGGTSKPMVEIGDKSNSYVEMETGTDLRNAG